MSNERIDLKQFEESDNFGSQLNLVSLIFLACVTFKENKNFPLIIFFVKRYIGIFNFAARYIPKDIDELLTETQQKVLKVLCINVMKDNNWIIHQNKEHEFIHKMQNDHRKEVSELKEEIRFLKDKVAELSKERTNRRRGINKHVRNEVICKQNRQCNACTKPLTEYNTNIDHKIGVQFGGTNDMDNLQALCVECHSEKTIKERRNCKKIRNAIEQILSE